MCPKDFGEYFLVSNSRNMRYQIATTVKYGFFGGADYDGDKIFHKSTL